MSKKRGYSSDGNKSSINNRKRSNRASLPSKLDICGQTYYVFYDDAPEGHAGLCYTDDCTILLSNQYSAGHLKDTLVHEILHAIFSVMPSNHVSGETEEFAIEVLTPGIIQVLRANPDLVKYILN